MANYIYSKDDMASMLKHVIETGEKWEHYDQTVAVADFWSKILSGKGHQDIIWSLRPNEKQDQKVQKARIYISRTKYVSNKITAQLKEIYRSDNILFDIFFTEKKDGDAERIRKIKESLNDFSGEKNVREWLRERFLRLNVIDPNAFLVTNFKINPDKSVSHYPIEVRSKNVLLRPEINGDLQFLGFKEICKVKATIKEKVRTVNAYKFWAFGHEYAVLYCKLPVGADATGLTPVDIKESAEKPITESIAAMGTDVKYSWYTAEYKIDAGQVPAFCVGYIPDIETDDKTFESIFSPAKDLFTELIWKKMEYDIHMILHGIAQKFVLVPSCNYADKQAGLECYEGKLTNGQECPSCGGTGQMPFHTSGQDIIALSLPKKAGDIPIDLSKLIHYQLIPIDVIKMGREEIDRTESAINQSIFNAAIVDRSKIVGAKTATEILDDSTGRNNVMYEFGLNDAWMYKKIVTQIAIYSDQWRDDLVVEYAYPADLNLETVNELFAELTEANTTKSPTLIKKKITSKLISKLCIDNQMALKIYETQEYWKPFSDKADAMMVPEFDPSRILFIYFDQIFRALDSIPYNQPGEKGGEQKEISFYMLPKDKQKEEIDKQVAAFTEQYRKAKDVSIAAAPVITVPRPSPQVKVA